MHNDLYMLWDTVFGPWATPKAVIEASDGDLRGYVSSSVATAIEQGAELDAEVAIAKLYTHITTYTVR